MKLRHQGVLLPGIALGSQLVFATILIITLLNVSVAAEKESKAKQVISCCQDIRIELLTYMRNIAAIRFIEIADLDAKQDDLLKRMITKSHTLEQLVAGDSESSKLVKEYIENLQKANVLIKDGAQSWRIRGDHYLARFIQEHEYFGDLNEAITRSLESEEAITRKYSRVAKELTRESRQAREYLLGAIICGIALTSIIIPVLALLSGRRIISRLGVLMENIRTFGQGGHSSTPLEGDDEFTELNKAFKEMSDAREAAENMRRSLFAMVSHDLRTPLTSIGMSLDIALEMHKDNLPSPVTKNIKRVSREVQRLSRLASGFLDLEKIEEGKLELFPDRCTVSDVVAPAVDAVKGLGDSKKLTILEEYDPLLEITCDVERLIQVVVNFLSNSIKFSPAGSEVTIRVGPDQNDIKFEVQDKGPGMTEDDQKKLFQKFSQVGTSASDKKLGTGLGLYICKMMVEAHGGTLGCYCDESGTHFWFKIPRSSTSEPEPA